jgi:hypothetical protein
LLPEALHLRRRPPLAAPRQRNLAGTLAGKPPPSFSFSHRRIKI